MPEFEFQGYREVMVKEFHEMAGAAIQEDATIKLVELRAKLIAEEAQELVDALADAVSFLRADVNPPKDVWIKVLDGMADLQVVLSGTCVTLKPLRNFARAFNRVHESNMTKTDGKIREDGKILKGPNYKPPILEDLV